MITPQIGNLISIYMEQSKRILQDNLTGIYLHGSAVMGCFNPEKSDIDLIIVVSQPLSDSIKRDYMEMVVTNNVLAPAKGIEMSIVLRNVCNPFVYPTPFELHFSAGHLEWYRNDPDDYIQRMNGTDRDLAAHFTVIRKRGLCLYGLPVNEVFAEVPAYDYMDSIWNDISDAPENIAKDTMYLTLNMARVLAYKEDALVLSKKEGGDWAVRNLPAQYVPLITAAMAEYTEAASVVYDVELARRYADYMIRRIQQ